MLHDLAVALKRDRPGGDNGTVDFCHGRPATKNAKGQKDNGQPCNGNRTDTAFIHSESDPSVSAFRPTTRVVAFLEPRDWRPGSVRHPAVSAVPEVGKYPW